MLAMHRSSPRGCRCKKGGQKYRYFETARKPPAKENQSLDGMYRFTAVPGIERGLRSNIRRITRTNELPNEAKCLLRDGARDSRLATRIIYV